LSAPCLDVQEPSAPQAARRLRLHSLTGLRFWAAVAVVFVHVSGHLVTEPSVSAAAQFGYLGVSFFFLLSGFVLTWSCSRQRAGTFLWARFSKIWPLQVLMMGAWFVLIAEHQPEPTKQTMVLLLAQAWDPRQSIYFAGNYVGWSLSCEMFFYLMFPLAILLIRRLHARGLAVVSAAVVALLVGAPLVTRGRVTDQFFFWLFYIFPLYRFGEFLLGMLLAAAVGIGLRLRAPRVGAVVAVVGLCGFVLSVTGIVLSTGWSVPRPLMAVGALPFFVLLILSCTCTELAAPRRPGWFRSTVRLGEWSFALYLVHVPLLVITQRWGWWDDDLSGMDQMFALAAFLLLAIAAAAVLHHGFEKPVERAMRGLSSRASTFLAVPSR
jgi:peptidoglycan/LPS O-acetylase OafA/YrhL